MSYIGLILLIVFSVVDPGEGPGGGGGGGGGGAPGPPLFLDQTEVRRAEKTSSDTRPPLLSGSGRLPPPPLI